MPREKNGLRQKVRTQKMILSLKELWGWCTGMCRNTEGGGGAEGWELLPLAPQYSDSEHKLYADAINNALDDPSVRNIALTGNYGVGKSSILKKVADSQKKRVVELSLSTLAPLRDADPDSAPDQAKTPTNRIQKEIVKQLLYREDPSKMRGSRFRRIERWSWPRELALALFAGFVVMVAFILAGWTYQIARELPDMPYRQIHLMVFATAAATHLALSKLFHGRIQIKQLAAGPASVNLAEGSTSYFDQYLDEIVYFFEASRRDIVIFEDIDRFDDAHIFETLRALNSLLNSSRVEKPVRFIYAIKDSIFGRIGEETEKEQGEAKQEARLSIDPAQAEIVRANRTKFFDLVIPVVPFITHRTARNHTLKLLEGVKHDVAPELVDLAGRYVPDMRLLKNVRNEFLVFRDRIFSGDGAGLHLSETELFAMMLYKSTHLADFDALRLGTSNLDKLYELSRRLVVENIRRIETKIRITRRLASRVDGAAARSVTLGEKLLDLVDRTARIAGHGQEDAQLLLNHEKKSEAEVKQADFWLEFVQLSGDPELIRVSGPYQSAQLTFARSDIAAALGINFDLSEWDKAERKDLDAQLKQLQEELLFLRSADMSDLMKRTDYAVDGTSFEEAVRQYLNEGFAFHLINAGYINRNFTLYTSTFHGNRVSPAATNFIIHHVERNVMDEQFELAPEDVEAVVRECGKGILTDPACYNISILDHLLLHRRSDAEILLKTLSQFSDKERGFLQAYLNGGREIGRFVEAFTKVTARALIHLVNDLEMSEEERIKLLDAALLHLAEDVVYRVDENVSSFLKANLAHMGSLARTDLHSEAAERIGFVVREAGFQVPDMLPYSDVMRKAFLELNLYAVNRENLVLLLGGNRLLALDEIRLLDERIYHHTLRDLRAYLSALEGDELTISGACFTEVLEDVLETSPDGLDEVVARSEKKCSVSDITSLSVSAWPILAHYDRFPASFSNIHEYFIEFEGVDEDLAVVLRDGLIHEHAAAEEERKVLVALAILNAQGCLSPQERASLVESLELQNYIDPIKIPVENGEFFALLLEKDVISDNKETYSHLLTADWPTREAYISASQKFVEYVSPSMILQGELAALFLSNKVAEKVKSAIAERADEFLEGATRQDLIQLVHFAVESGLFMAIETLEKLASRRISPASLITLLENHLDSLPTEQLSRILRDLGHPYDGLASVGWSRPKVPDAAGHRALLESLKRRGIVSKYKQSGGQIKVSKRRK